MIVITQQNNITVFPDATPGTEKRKLAFQTEYIETLEGGRFHHEFNNCLITEFNNDPDNKELTVKIKYDTDKRSVQPNIFPFIK